MVGTVFSLTGCVMAAREVIGTVRGGHSSTDVVQPIANLGAYHNVVVGAFQNAVGPEVTTAYLTAFYQDLNQQLQSQHLMQGTQPTLKISGRITSFRSSVGYRHMTVDVLLQDAKTGVVLGEAKVVGKVSGARSFSEVLSATAVGIVELITQNQNA